MKAIRKIVLSLAALFSTLTMAAVYTPKSVPSPKNQGQAFYVADPDTLLNDSDVVFLNRCARMLEDATDVELCVVALRSIGDADAFDFSFELFQTWGIGARGKNTGVLVLFVLDSHDIRIMTGTGIEGILTDARCSQIIRDDMTPAFRAGHYGEGLCLGALRIYEICTDGTAPEELLNMTSVTNRGKYAPEGGGKSDVWLALLCSIGVIGVYAGFFTLIWYAWPTETRKCPKCKKRRAHKIADKVLTAATYGHGGNGERTYKCKKCGNIFVVAYKIPKLSHSSGSSSGRRSHSGGSWGGGSSSGGGAGGKW
ncbi:MAG: TPM domain-containing protein [Paludibacteraceae bacterium]|nr:TPM domain-containing protein [Paludibacteraceae bacterium]